MDGRKSSMFRKSADRALIGEVNYSLRFCPVCNLPESRRCSRSTRRAAGTTGAARSPWPLNSEPRASRDAERAGRELK